MYKRHPPIPTTHPAMSCVIEKKIDLLSLLSPELLSRVGTFLPEESPLIGAMATVNAGCKAVFQDQSRVIADNRRYEQLRAWVVDQMVNDEGYHYEVLDKIVNIEDDMYDDGSYIGVFVHDIKATSILYLFRGDGNSVVLSPSGAFKAWDNMEIYNEDDWETLYPWLDLVDLINFDVDLVDLFTLDD